jgi:hypothetical protein
MIPKAHYPYIILGLFVGLMIVHSLWCQYVAYPISFEKNLKKGKSWVYIPLRWKGFYKVQIQFFTRIIMISMVALGIFLLSHYTHKSGGTWLAAFGVGLGALIWKLNSLWLDRRYHQQEDSYYYLHDELRTKLEAEGKDIADSAFKNLAAYQHQNLLRKADEKGQLIKTLSSQAKQSRKYRQQIRSKEPVET